MNKLIVLFVAILFLSITQTAAARSGCCSHHGGVCGCGCCDGTGLSTTCAPYYPECNKPPSPTPTPTPNPTIISASRLNPSPTAAESTTSKGDAVGGLIAFLIFSGLGIGIAKFIIGKGNVELKK